MNDQFKLNLNDIPQEIASGFLTEDDAIKKIASFFINNRKVFNLFHKNESKDDYNDKISEITEYLLFNGKKILHRYNEERGSFFNYLYTVIVNKDRIIRHAANLSRSTRFITRNILGTSALEEENPFSDYTFNQVQSRQSSQEPKTKSKGRTVREVIKDRKTLFKNKFRILLTLKSCIVVHDSDIQETSAATGTDLEDFYRCIEMINSKMDIKRERLKQHIRKRNSAYILMNSYKSQLSVCDAFYEYKTMDLQRKVQKKEDQWKMTQVPAAKTCPSNKLIADTLNLNVRTISYYMEKGWKLYGEESQNIEEN